MIKLFLHVLQQGKQDATNWRNVRRDVPPAGGDSTVIPTDQLLQRWLSQPGH